MDPTITPTAALTAAASQAPQAYGLEAFLQQADAVTWTVLAILLVMSVSSWEVMLYRGFTLWWMRHRAVRALARFWRAEGLATALTGLAQAERGPFARLAERGAAALQHYRRQGSAQRADGLNTAEFLTRALRQGLDEETARLEAGLTVLASVGSTAPFVGLFGTVWGIHHALVRIGTTGQAGIDQVAGPVGEALIMTAIGLAVAVPAVLAYNALTRGNRRLSAALDTFAHDYFTWLATGARPAHPGAEAHSMGAKLKEVAA